MSSERGLALREDVVGRASSRRGSVSLIWVRSASAGDVWFGEREGREEEGETDRRRGRHVCV